MANQSVSRRQLLMQTAAGIALMAARPTHPRKITLQIIRDLSLGVTPANFLGFGYEISSIATPALLAAYDSALVAFYRTLGPGGVIRVGGNTSDFAVWSPNGVPAALPKGSVTSTASIRELGTFLHATGWNLIWGLNLGQGTPESAADQAAAVAEAAGNRLLAFEIGNEPDLFIMQGHRKPGYDYSAYHRDFDRFAGAVRKRTPKVSFAGPDVFGATDWVESFARDEGDRLKLLTEHYYALGPPESPHTTIGNLLTPDRRFATMTKRLAEIANVSRLPYRLVEVNSCYGGGKAGVSDTLASALWGLDLMHTLALNEGAGINWQTGVNQLGWVSHYTPIGDDGKGSYSARPLYYAMLAFSIAGIGRRVTVELRPHPPTLASYAVMTEDGHTWLTLINKDVSAPAEVRVASTKPIGAGELLRLTAPAIDSTTGVTLGGIEVSKRGEWQGQHPENIRIQKGGFEVEVGAASAALIRLS